jgi:serine/threonine-protein phosphatase 2A regulatory subunit B
MPVTTLKIPMLATTDSIVAATPRRVFSNAHAYHINSISLNSDGETYISSDDLRINLWNLDISNQSFSASAAARRGGGGSKKSRELRQGV